MEEKDDWTCGREGDRHPFTQTNLQDEFIPPIMLVLTYISVIMSVIIGRTRIELRRKISLRVKNNSFEADYCLQKLGI